MTVKFLNNLKLRTHIMISVGTIVFLALSVTISFVAVKNWKLAQSEAMDKAREIAGRQGNYIRADIEVAMNAARTLARAFEGIKRSGAVPDRKMINRMIARVLEDNPGFTGICSVWEPDALDGRDLDFANTPHHDETGRFIQYLYRDGGVIKTMALETFRNEPWYTLPESNMEEVIMDPFVYRVREKDILMTTLSVPVLDEGSFAGIVAVDIDLTYFKELLSEKRVFETGYISVISNGGIYLSHPDSKRVGKPAVEEDAWLNPHTGAIKNGEGFITRSFSKTIGDFTERIGIPIQIGRTQTPWIVMVNIPEEEITASAKSIMYLSIIIGGFSIIVLMLVIYFISRSITTPLIKGVGFAKKMSEGDFTQRLDIDQKDEIGVLSGALNNMRSDLRGMIKEITTGVETLSSSSSDLAAISEQMAQGANQTSEKSGAVAAAAEEMSSGTASVAAAMDQASTNLTIVAAASEEMTLTINDVAESTESARSITINAVALAKTASEKIVELGEASKEIDKVTETITDISEQTNLLALNATIEAARAGAAGRGFAVVATEIKELARLTAEATGDIREKISGIQQATRISVDAIEEIAGIIDEINDVVANTAAAVEEQSASTREIAGNVAQASRGLVEINESFAQTSRVSEEITADISEVSRQSEEMEESSTIVGENVSELLKLAEKLKEMVGSFKV